MSVAGSDRVKILWEDDDLIAVEKPTGLVVDEGVRKTFDSPASELPSDLLSVVRGFGKAYESVFAFHRLDRETSGVVLLGKTRRQARGVTQAFEEKRIRKAYLAVVRGEWPTTLTRVAMPIEDRASLTTYRRLATGSFHAESASLLECLPKTGRTHQIRIHCSSSGFPILGDARYGAVDVHAAPRGAADSDQGHALHAYRLDFRHPADGREISVRSAPLLWQTSWLAAFDIEKFWSQTFPMQALP